MLFMLVFYPDCMFEYLKTLRKTALIKPLQGDFKVWVQINFQPFVKGNGSAVCILFCYQTKAFKFS